MVETVKATGDRNRVPDSEIFCTVHGSEEGLVRSRAATPHLRFIVYVDYSCESNSLRASRSHQLVLV
jgi:hypothetical protein